MAIFVLVSLNEKIGRDEIRKSRVVILACRRDYDAIGYVIYISVLIGQSTLILVRLAYRG